MTDTRVCKQCDELLPLERFRLSPNGNNTRKTCKGCEMDRLNRWRKGQPAGVDHRAGGNRRKVREKLIRKQGGKCAICNRVIELVLDHCHRTGIVRGALCHRCNTGLGRFQDDADLLESAVCYLRQFMDPA